MPNFLVTDSYLSILMDSYLNHLKGFSLDSYFDIDIIHESLINILHSLKSNLIYEIIRFNWFG